ncbi:acyl transferase 15 [Oryza sativa Japonica Group]|uniref:Os10g0107400 protein n=4 Tax=Oryza sativa subsp. japonica TaxID=39947 RepID=B9G5A1_ORYSJ|nr:acyl transferase 15 [Oryza sativa Japonica Group]XP_025876740.1 acyl transferase 15 [Oryza sativa Japonica Group]XP_025876741.1 acyl transferase 15 [Oryza sativa Japonica Group]EEE50458.1 hypothetical protein OsJ_30482 [Oryza sativa Japonica Group]KAF2912361.1 hypothetical protein DAI22_10g003800 [Oryza sativa Japonica Group]BAT09609.1 Os10g0107400 [Oryza sativa Japonica Group]
MSTVVSKSAPVVVRPSEPPVKTSSSKIVLSPLEMPLAMVPMTVLLAFEHPIIHHHQPTADTIKMALAQALVHYYPIAGRLSCNDDEDGGGDFYIDCTSELGVMFVAASADCTMEELMRVADNQPTDDETAVVQQLAFNCTPDVGDDGPPPLLWVQVTTLSCGGFVVGVTWSHGLADGVGIAQFIQAVGELARGLPSPSIVPVRQDDIVATQVVPPFTMALLQFLPGLKPLDLTFNNVTVPTSLINHIRRFRGRRTNDDGGQHSTTTITAFEAVAAVLWKCRTRAVMASPEAPAILVFVVNARKYLAGVNDGYYGNCSMMHMAMAKSGAVANGDIMDVVEIIRRAKERIPEQFGEGSDRMVRELSDGQQVDGYESLLYLTSWRNIGLEEVDFGSGKTARVMTYPQRMLFSLLEKTTPICFMLMPTKEGARVMSGCVTPDHVDAFQQQILKLNANYTAT